MKFVLRVQGWRGGETCGVARCDVMGACAVGYAGMETWKTGRTAFVDVTGLTSHKTKRWSVGHG